LNLSTTPKDKIYKHIPPIIPIILKGLNVLLKITIFILAITTQPLKAMMPVDQNSVNKPSDVEKFPHTIK